jgi:BMFP domain-containing protein YqiC
MRRAVRRKLEGTPMTQTSNRLLDEMAKLMTDAAGAAQGLRQEAENLMRAQGEKILANMDIVKREEFEAVKAMAEKARTENERLAGLVAALEARIASLESGGPSRT